MNGEDITSADQDAWIEISQAIRVGLLKAAVTIPAMNPTEVKEFVAAARDAMWMEINAQTFDKQIELEKQKLFQN